MKSLKRITSTLLSMTIISGIAAAGLPQKTTTFAANSKVMYQDVLSQWQTRINNEKAKYPNKSYWNHKGLSSYNDETHTNQPCYHVQDYAKGEKCCNQTIIETGENKDSAMDLHISLHPIYGELLNSMNPM